MKQLTTEEKKQLLEKVSSGELELEQALKIASGFNELSMKDLNVAEYMMRMEVQADELRRIQRMILFRPNQPKCWKPEATTEGFKLIRQYGLRESLIGRIVAELLVKIDSEQE